MSVIISYCPHVGFLHFIYFKIHNGLVYVSSWGFLSFSFYTWIINYILLYLYLGLHSVSAIVLFLKGLNLFDMALLCNRWAIFAVYQGLILVSYICPAVYCGGVPGVANGFVVNFTNARYEGEVRYGCFEGFSMPPGDSAVVRCQADGTWEAAPECNGMLCPVLSM